MLENDGEKTIGKPGKSDIPLYGLGLVEERILFMLFQLKFSFFILESMILTHW